MAHPVTFHADYVEKRSRLTTFFRLILVIPHAIVLIFYAIAAWVVIVVAWFALLFTGRWPQGMYDFVAGFWRYSTAVTGYCYLLTDEYPPFGPETDTYPVRLEIAPPMDVYSRLKVLFRIVLAIPPYLISYAMGIVAQIGALLSWFAIVFLGKQPKGLQDMIVLGVSYQQRAYCYMSLLTEDWPPFTDDSTRQVEAAPESSFGALSATPPAAAAGGPEAPTSLAAPPAAPEAPAPPPPPQATPGDPLGAPPPPADDDEEPPQPGPFGPSSTNP